MRGKLFHGGSGLDAVERRFEALICRYNIDVHNHGTIAAELEVLPSFASLAIRYSQRTEKIIEAAAIQLGLLVLGHLRGDSWWMDEGTERQSRREWREAVRWAADFLIPESKMDEAEQLGWDEHQLAFDAEVTPFIASVKIYGRARLRGLNPSSPFFGYQPDL